MSAKFPTWACALPGSRARWSLRRSRRNTPRRSSNGAGAHGFGRSGVRAKCSIAVSPSTSKYPLQASGFGSCIRQNPGREPARARDSKLSCLPRGRSTPGVTAIRPIATTKSEQIKTDEDRFAQGESAVTPKRRCGVGVDLLDAAPHGAGLGRASFRHARIRTENQLNPIYARSVSHYGRGRSSICGPHQRDSKLSA